MVGSKIGTFKSDLDSFNVFPWNSNFETGIELIDEQHKVLVSLLNKLSETLINEKETEINEAFEALADYTKMHFNAEEEIWNKYFIDDPKLCSHKEVHRSFLPKVIEMRGKEGDKTIVEVVEDIVKFLIRWLAFHIIDNDKRMAFVVHAMNSGNSLETAKSISNEKMGGAMSVLIETVMNMYDVVSSRAIDLMRERRMRIKAENELKKANSRLKELSIKDQLTGLHNRRYFDKVFDKELKRCKRTKTPLSFIIMDVDNFKKYNDNYGHLGGDMVLKKVAEKLKECCRRPTDFAFRIGGEEFGVLSVDDSMKQSVDFAEILRSSIEGLKIRHDYNNASGFVTVSIGLCTAVPEIEDDVDDFIKKADDMLYKAKENGRNRVEISSANNDTNL